MRFILPRIDLLSGRRESSLESLNLTLFPAAAAAEAPDRSWLDEEALDEDTTDDVTEDKEIFSISSESAKFFSLVTLIAAVASMLLLLLSNFSAFRPYSSSRISSANDFLARMDSFSSRSASLCRSPSLRREAKSS